MSILQGTLVPNAFILTHSRGVAVGSSIGHAIGGFFGGGSSQPQANVEQAEGALTPQTADGNYKSNSYSQDCEVDAKAFTRCLDENKGEYQMSVCGWYLEQLVCQNLVSIRCLKLVVY